MSARQEPYRLRRWRFEPPYAGVLWTAARPGRSKGPAGEVRDEVVRRWLEGAPSAVDVLVSLLGVKHGESELKFYNAAARAGFGAWLNGLSARRFEVAEFATIDFEPVPAGIVAAVGDFITPRIRSGRSVLMFDSGGVERTGQICAALGALPAKSLFDR